MIRATCIFLILLASPALAQKNPEQALRIASANIMAATTALANAEQAEDQAATLTQAILSLESGLGSLRVALQVSSVAEQEKQAQARVAKQELGNLLAILGAMNNTPAPLTMLHPDGATAAARAGIVLTAITPEMQARVAVLQQDLQQISELTAAHDSALATLQAALLALQSARADLATLSEDAPQTQNPALTASLSQLADASQSLSHLARQINTLLPQDAAPISQDFGSLRGRLAYPVSGTLSRGFNAPNAAGIRQPGIVLVAAPLSLVLAPQVSTVRFAGEFLEYGQVVILEPAPGHLQIYAGFGQLYVNSGDVLASGAALGLLGGEMPDSAEFLAESSGVNDKGAESLYIEIRENGIPVDPTTWFATN